MAYPSICLYTSHFGTVGAVAVDGTQEERIFRVIVPRAVELLRNAGFTTVVHGGVTGHEITQHQANPNAYDVCISNHFNVGQAMLLFNGNRRNPRLQAFTNEFNARLAQFGVVNSGAISRPDLAMLNGGNAELYLLEWCDGRRANEIRWLNDTEARALDLADFVRRVLLDGKYMSSAPNVPTPPTNGVSMFDTGVDVLVDSNNLGVVEQVAYDSTQKVWVARVRLRNGKSDVYAQTRLIGKGQSFMLDGKEQVEVTDIAVDANGNGVVRTSRVVFASRLK